MKTFIIEIQTELDHQTLQTLLGNLLLVSGTFNDIKKIHGVKIKEIEK